MRAYHWLRALKRDSWPRTILAVGWSSAEAPSMVPGVMAAGTSLDSWALSVLHLTNGVYVCTDTAEGFLPLHLRDTVRDFTPRGGPTWLVTVNACHFAALAGIWEALDRGEWELPPAPEGGDYRGHPSWQGCCVLSDPPTILHLGWPGAAAGVQLIDVRNWGEIGWTDLCAEAQFGLKDCGDAVTGRDGGMHYAHGRRLALTRWLISWGLLLKENGFGGWRTTAASQGMSAWRRRRLTVPVLCHSNAAVLRLERDTLHAGRTEAMRLGHVSGPLLHYDFVSYYPALAQMPGLPCVFRHHWTGRQPQLEQLIDDGWIVSARVQIETEQPDWPYTTADGTCWPIGVFCTALAHPELCRALDRGAVRQVFETAAYEPEAPLVEVMADLRRLRHQAKARQQPATAAALKATANMLLGKLASAGMEWVPADDIGTVENWCQFPEWNGALRKWERIRVVAGRAFRQSHALTAPESVPALTAHVWSAGRDLMADVIEAATRYHTVYVGTDAVVVAACAAPWLAPFATSVGSPPTRLRLKGALEWIRVYGSGHYDTPGGSHHTGVPLTAAGSWADGYSWQSPQKPDEAIASAMPPLPLLLPRSLKRRAKVADGAELGDGRIKPKRVHKPY